MNYGQLRLQITQENPGIALEKVDGWIQDRYTEILDRIPWKRQQGESVLQVPASYATGTLVATLGSNAIVGTGTVFTAAMTGRMIRIDATSEFYQFTFVDATHGTLDRGWEHPTTAASTFRIDQAVYLMPADCRIVGSCRGLHDLEHPLERVTPGELNRRAGQRTTYGTPTMYAPTFDNFSDPPIMQVEFYPIPDSPNTGSEVLSYVCGYDFDASVLDAGETSASLLPWVRPAALKAGVKASKFLDKENFAAAKTLQEEMDRIVAIMARVNAAQIGPEPIRLSPEYTRRRYVGGNYPVNRPWDGE